jgi:hypothetical protein
MNDEYSEDEWRELHSEVRAHLLRAYPNPNRVGCPGIESLKRLVLRQLPPGHPVAHHVMECSPCYQEVLDLRAQLRGHLAQTDTPVSPRRNTQLLRWGALATGFFLVGLLVIQTWRLQLFRVGGNAIMNFATSVNRGVSGTAEQQIPEIQSYPRKRLSLTVSLPPGSEAGEYQFQILPMDRDAPLLQANGRATIAHGLTTFRTEINLSGVEPGIYRARVRRPPLGNWKNLTIHVK